MPAQVAPREDPSPDAILRAAAVGGLAATAGTGAAAASGPATSVGGGTTAVVTGAQVAAAVAAAMGALRTGRAEDADWLWLIQPLGAEFPELGEDVLVKRAREEAAFEAEFFRRMDERLKRDLPKALAAADPEASTAALLRRERYYLRQHEEAQGSRVIAAVRRQRVKELSPEGAFWRMSPLVKEHTPDCIAMALVGWWPWEVLDRIHPPMHPGCPCELLTRREAQDLGLLGDKLPSTKGAVERAEEIVRAHGVIQEAFWLETDSREALKEAALEFAGQIRDLSHELVGMSSSRAKSTPEVHANVNRFQGEQQGGCILEIRDISEAGDLSPKGDNADRETPAQRTGIMVALYPDSATATELAVRGGEHPENLHVTLAYLGKITDGLSEDEAIRVVRAWATGCPPLKGEISGYGYFVGGPDGKLTYASVDLPEIPAQRQRLVDDLRSVQLPPSATHGFTPHMTLDYASRRPKLEDPVPLTFSKVTLVWGDARYEFPLTGRPMATQIMEGLVDYAEAELERAGLFSEDSDYDGMLGDAILDCVKTFSKAGHSGGSAAITVAALEKLLRYQPLTPLTSDPAEWQDVSDFSGKPLWQSRRNPAAFSEDGGKTWTVMEAREQPPLSPLDLEELRWDRRYAEGTVWGGRFMPKRGGFAPRISLGDIMRRLLGPDSPPLRRRGDPRPTINVPDAPGMASPGTPSAPRPRRPGTPSPDFDATAADVRTLAEGLAAQHNAPLQLGKIEAGGFDTEGWRSFDGDVRVGAEGAAAFARYAEMHARGQRIDDDTSAEVYHALRTTVHEATHSVNPLTGAEYMIPANFALEEALTEEIAHMLTVDYLKANGGHDTLRWLARKPADLRAEGVYQPQRAALGRLLDEANVPVGDRRQLLEAMKFGMRPDQRRAVLGGLVARANDMSPASGRKHVETVLTAAADEDALAGGHGVLRPDIDLDMRTRIQPGATVRVGERYEGKVVDAGWGQDGQWMVEVETKTAKGDTTLRYPMPEEVEVLKDAPRRRLKGAAVTGTVREGDTVEVTHRNGKTEEMRIRRVERTRKGEDWEAEALDSQDRPVALRPSSVKSVKRVKSKTAAPEPAEAPEPAASAPEPPPEPAKPVVPTPEAPVGELEDVEGPRAFDARRYEDPRRSLLRKMRALPSGGKLQMADGSVVEHGKQQDSVLMIRPDGSRRRYASTARLANAEMASIAARHGIPYDAVTHTRPDTELALQGMASPGLPKILKKLASGGQPADAKERSEFEAPPDPVVGIPSYHGVELTDVKAAGGSNGARFAEDADGNRWLVKTYKGNRDRVATELLANAVYRELGVQVPNAGHTEVKVPNHGPTQSLTYPLVDGEERKWSTPHEGLAEGFVADALLANWDVVGLTQDNVLWNGDDPIRLDQGGTLEYRAMGGKKDFGPVPTELWTMNKPGGQAFGRMAITDSKLRAQAADAELRLTPERVDALIDAAPFKDEGMRERVRENLKARVAWLGRFGRGEENLPEPLDGPDTRAAFDARDAELETTPDEDEALDLLMGPGGSAIDDHLRSGAPKDEADDEVRDAVATLDALLADPVAKSPDEWTGYIAAPDSVGGLDEKGLDALVNNQLREPSYLRLATEFEPTAGVVKITVPEGFPAIMPGALEGVEHDSNAAILPRGTKVQITGWSMDGDQLTLAAVVRR